MADIETNVENETTTKVVSSPEKKIVDEEKKVVEEEVDEDSKSSENGEGENGKVTENGKVEEKESEADEVELPKNGCCATEEAVADACSIKRKSVSGDATDGAAVDGASPEKKAKLDEKSAETESNGEAAEAKA